MKFKLFSTAFALLLFTLAFSQKNTGFVLTGHIASLKSDTIVLGYYKGVNFFSDTAIIKNGKFRFNGFVDRPTMAYLTNHDDFFREQYIENSKMTIFQKDTSDDIVFKGSAFDKENEDFKKNNGSLTGGDYHDAVIKYIKDHPRNLYSLTLLSQVSGDWDTKELKSVFELLDKNLQSSTLAIGIKRRIKGEMTSYLNQPAFAFSQKTAQGKTIHLSDYKGKYVLIDFWASWCAPCRAENPKVVKAYNRFKEKGFDVLSIALDTKEDKWKEAVIKDKLPWTQVSDLKGWENAVASQYNIYFIPANFLVDPAGIIVAMNLRGNALEEKLSEIFNTTSGFTLAGKIAQLKSPAAVLMYESGGKNISDTVLTDNGYFSFSGKVDEPTYANITSTDGRFGTWIFLESNKMTINQKDSGDWIMMTGSITEDTNRIIKKSYRKYQQLSDAAFVDYDSLAKIDSGLARTITLAKMDTNDSILLSDRKSFIYNHPKSIVSAYELSKIYRDIDFTEFQSLYARLDKSVQESINGRRVAMLIASGKKTATGATAINFTQKNVAGKNVSLTDFKGKYVLIDFWASWCGPCREENPNLVKCYNTYKNKGFSILGVSLDDNAEKWKKAILADKLEWEHVSDLKGWKNEVGLKYGVTGVPANFLIDPMGNIIAKNLRGEALERKLEEIFQN